MFKIALVFSALLAVAVSSPLNYGLGAPLLPKVSYEPAEVKSYQPEITVKAPEYQYKAVPYAVPYAQPVATPVAYSLPDVQAIAYSAAVAPQPITYTAAVDPQPMAYPAALPYSGY